MFSCQVRKLSVCLTKPRYLQLETVLMTCWFQSMLDISSDFSNDIAPDLSGSPSITSAHLAQILADLHKRRQRAAAAEMGRHLFSSSG